MYLFGINVRYMKRLVELSRVVSNRIEKGDIQGPPNTNEILRINELVLLNSLSNIMMVVESTLALCSALGERWTDGIKIAEHMSHYDQNQIDGFIDRLKDDKVNVWRLAGFPRMAILRKNCRLTRLESKFVWELLHESCDLIKGTLDSIVEFYQKNRIIYGKFKHGLTFLLGFEMYSPSVMAAKGLPATAILAFDRRRRQPDGTCVNATGLSERLSWFNTISVLSYSKETLAKHDAILSDTERLVSHITNNHLLCAENCGEDYFPAEQENQIWKAALYLRRELSQEDQATFESVMEKILPSLLTIDRSLVVEFKLGTHVFTPLSERLLRDTVATIFSSTGHGEPDSGGPRLNVRTQVKEASRT